MTNRQKRRAKKRQTATGQYTGPRHEEQYLPALLQMHAAGLFASKGIYIVDVVHDEANDGNVAEIAVRQVGPQGR
jgi:hypothetical protein